MMNKYTLTTRFAIILGATLLSSCSQTPHTAAATPDEIQTRIETSNAPIVLAHVWATWCDPCREEFPELIEAYKQYEKKGVELLLISADDPADSAAVNVFLEEHECPVNSLIATELSQKFIETLSPKWAGSLPSTFFYSNGQLLAEWEGKRTKAQYVEKIEELLTP